MVARTYFTSLSSPLDPANVAVWRKGDTDAGSTSLGLKADVKPGQIRGQAFYSVWFVVSPQGKAIKKSPR